MKALMKLEVTNRRKYLRWNLSSEWVFLVGCDTSFASFTHVTSLLGGVSVNVGGRCGFGGSPTGHSWTPCWKALA